MQVIPLENPRQTSAFDYAPDYSPQSPRFSRAMAIEVGTDAMTLVSGTASITRSETQHTVDAAAQTMETLANIERSRSVSWSRSSSPLEPTNR